MSARLGRFYSTFSSSALEVPDRRGARMLLLLEDGVALAREKVTRAANLGSHLLLSCTGGSVRLGQGDDDFDAPMSLELSCPPGEPGGWREYLGVYMLENREINGKPAWRHVDRPGHWLAFDGVSARDANHLRACPLRICRGA